MKKYEVNSSMHSSYLRNDYKKHPKWIARKKIRVILNSLVILAPILSILIALEDSGFRLEHLNIEGLVYLLMATSIIFYIPGLGYGKILGATCSGGIEYREDESLIITEDGIVHSYHPSDAGNRFTLEGKEIEFKDIYRIIFNKNHNRIDVYGDLTLLHCSDTRDREIKKSKSKFENPRIRICLYFNDSDEILKTIEERSPVKMEVIDYPAE